MGGGGTLIVADGNSHLTSRTSHTTVERKDIPMDKKSIIIAVLLAFIVGCGVATVAPQIVIR